MASITSLLRFLVRGGPTASAQSDVPLARELLLDTTTRELHVGDGSTPGGLPLTVGTPTDARHPANKEYVDTGLAECAPSGHTHSYAGSSVPGGAATKALACSGNSATATALASARTLTIGAAGKTFNGTAGVTWSLSEIGAAPAADSLLRDRGDYVERAGNWRCLIPLASTGDGSGVLTIRIYSSTANTATLSSGYFTDSSGAANFGTATAMSAGALTTLYIKVASGTANLVISAGWALTTFYTSGYEFVVEGSNAPKLSGFDLKFVPWNVRGVRVNSSLGLSVISGAAGVWPDASIVHLLGSAMTAVVNLSTSCIYSGSAEYDLFLYGSSLSVSYPSSRPWPATLSRIYMRPSAGSMVSADVDRLLNDLASWVAAAGAVKSIDLRGNCGAATSASATARAYLVGLGFAVSVKT